MAGSTLSAPPITEIDVLWITAGLGCDGDTIAMTAATQPSIEDIVMGGMPWIPKVNFHNPFLSLENGDEFLQRFHLAAEGGVDPFILVVEGSIPNEKNKQGGLLGIARHRRRDRPANHDLRVDRPPRPACLGRDRRGHLRHLWRYPCHGGQSHRLHGPARLPRMELAVYRKHTHRLCPRLSHTARQFHGDAALSSLHGRGPRPRDPS